LAAVDNPPFDPVQGGRRPIRHHLQRHCSLCSHAFAWGDAYRGGSPRKPPIDGRAS
jgi:hypothetical protein